jgi:predicted dehydrogenase
MKGAMTDMGLEPPAVVSIRRSAGAYAEDGTGRHEFLLDFCLHAIDLAVWLAGPPSEVTAYSPSANAWSVSARTEQGTALSLALAGASWGFPDEQVAVYGVDRGFIEGRDMRQLLLCADGEMRDVYRVDFSTAGQDGLDVSGFLPEIAAFVEAVNTGDRSGIRSDMWSSYRSMVLYEGIKRSAQTRAPVQLHYEGPSANEE